MEPAHIRVSPWVFPGDVSGPLVRAPARICYTLRMFIHRVFITGRSDRGAWPWRQPV